MLWVAKTHLIDGGVPAGNKIRPEEEGWVMMRRNTRTITIQGNNRTKPSGIEIAEFLRSRIRRLKKANLGIMTPFSFETLSKAGAAVKYGARFARRCTNPMGADTWVWRNSARTEFCFLLMEVRMAFDLLDRGRRGEAGEGKRGGLSGSQL